MGTKGEAFTASNSHLAPMQSKTEHKFTGKPDLPDPKEFCEKYFKRREFRPDPQGTNLMFAFMAQHFTHQFFKKSHKATVGFTKALGHGVRHECNKQRRSGCSQHLLSIPDLCVSIQLGRCKQHIWRRT